MLFFFSFFFIEAQERTPQFVSKKALISEGKIFLDSINYLQSTLVLKDKTGAVLNKSQYRINNKEITFSNYISDSIQLEYIKIPDFLTKKYTTFDESQIVSNGSTTTIQISQPIKTTQRIFSGLNASGSISRGVSLGNNQNSVLNSNLDLQISGNLSSAIKIKASIQDNNIPVQQNGYSQRLDEFDQIFVELSSKNWNVRAGDLFIENRNLSFLNFNKKVQGLNTNVFWGKKNKTNLYASGAVVRGQYAKSTFVGIEGNQGPYKLQGNQGQLYVLIISGSEKVFVNGVVLERGENKDYVIDYNAGEIIFNATYPINSEKRIVVEYQFSDRNYNRFFSYDGMTYQTTRSNVGFFYYTESDIKNQTLQQNLTANQIEVLKNAGDDISLMNAISAIPETYSPNKILYKKVMIAGVEIFEYSTDANAELFQVKFSLVGNNNGNYKLVNASTVGKIYQYIAPINGVKQGNFEPIIPLIAPVKLSILNTFANFKLNKKSSLETEIAFSNQDKNLFAIINDNDNNGFAGKIFSNAVLISNKNELSLQTKVNVIQQNFAPVERLFNIEFNRDWNIFNPKGNQVLIENTINFIKKDTLSNWKFAINYKSEYLSFSKNYIGLRNGSSINVARKNIGFISESNLLNSSGEKSNTLFLRTYNSFVLKKNKTIFRTKFDSEVLEEKDKLNATYQPISQRFYEVGQTISRGDSVADFHEIGLLYRINDSVQDAVLKRVNKSISAYYKTNLINTTTRKLSLFFNYRSLLFENNTSNQNNLNTRILYNDSYFKGIIQNSFLYETVNGNVAQQEFTFIEVEPTRGQYMWNDYNNNGIQELPEFEIASFPDLAKYIKVFLPNQIFLRTNQNRLSQSLIFDGNKFNKFKFIKRIYNQATFFVDKKNLLDKEVINFNLFKSDNIIANNQSFRNTLFFNKAKQKYSFIYTYTSSFVKNQLNFGFQENQSVMNQLSFIHLVKKIFLTQIDFSESKVNSFSENYNDRNFDILSYKIIPKLTFLFSKNSNLEFFAEWNNKENMLGLKEKLNQQIYGLNYVLNSDKNLNITANFAFTKNDFTGNSNSAVGFQMMNGLQAGENLNWGIVIQRNITQYLDLSVNYLGRKTDFINPIHNGSVTIRAFF